MSLLNRHGQRSLYEKRRTGALRRPFLRLPAKIGLFVLAVVAMLAFFWNATRPQISVIAEDGLLASCPADAGMEFSTSFIHSVQKTPVWRRPAVSADGRFLPPRGRLLRHGRHEPPHAGDSVSSRSPDRPDDQAPEGGNTARRPCSHRQSRSRRYRTKLENLAELF